MIHSPRKNLKQDGQECWRNTVGWKQTSQIYVWFKAYVGARIREKNLLSYEQNRFECICAKYDKDGILCCHVLRLLTQLGIHKILDAYIKERWLLLILKMQLRSRRWSERIQKETKVGNKQTYMHWWWQGVPQYMRVWVRI